MSNNVVSQKLLRRVDSVLKDLGVIDSDRQDAGETAMIAKQLEHVFTRTKDVKYPAYKARSFIPVNTEVSNGAESHTYSQWDEYGMAKLIADYAGDLPNVDATVKEFTARIRSVGTSYQYSIQDLRASAMAGAQLDSRRAMIARRRVESKLDELAAFGDADSGLSGFTNNANVPLTTPDTGSWASATAAQILADLRKMQNTIVVTTKGVFTPDTLLLDTASFELLAQKELSADNPKTVMQQFLETSPHIRNIDSWHKLDEADVAGTGPRAVMYARSPEVVELVIAQEFEQFPPQARNLAFVVPCHARLGGVNWYYPLAASYMDGI